MVVKGGNYGWPYVAGYQDDKGYAYANFSAAKGGCKGDEDQYQNGLKVAENIPVKRKVSGPLKRLWRH